MPPPSPPALDDVLSQMSQRDFSSTQLFRTNSEYFNRSKYNGTTTAIGLPAFDNQRPFSQGVYNSHQSDQNRQNSWLTSGSQLALSTNLQPSLLIDDQNNHEDEYLEVVQDSPELFSQWMELEHTDKSEGMYAIFCYTKATSLSLGGLGPASFFTSESVGAARGPPSILPLIFACPSASMNRFPREIKAKSLDIVLKLNFVPFIRF